MFGRAIITLGIGPHSSLKFFDPFFKLDDSKLLLNVNARLLTTDDF